MSRVMTKKVKTRKPKGGPFGFFQKFFQNFFCAFFRPVDSPWKEEELVPKNKPIGAIAAELEGPYHSRVFRSRTGSWPVNPDKKYPIRKKFMQGIQGYLCLSMDIFLNFRG